MNTHPLRTGYLVIGLVYLGVAATWALSAADLVDAGDSRWLLPLSLVLAGGIGLAATAARTLRGTKRPESAESREPGDPADIHDQPLAVDGDPYNPYGPLDDALFTEDEATRPLRPTREDDQR